MKKITFIILAVGILISACGKKDDSTVCPLANPEVGKKVYYTGYKTDAGPFKNGQDYVGLVKAVFNDGNIEADFAPGVGSKKVATSQVQAEAKCTIDYTGKRAAYNGYRTDKGSFRNDGGDYFGIVVTGFSGDYFQINWEKYPGDVYVHSKSQLNLEK